MSSHRSFRQKSLEMAREVDHILEYQRRCQAAKNFAGDTPGPAWNGLYQLGLAIAGLVLIPVESGIDHPSHWVFAPLPNKDPDNPDHPDWGASWLAEAEAFSTPTEVTDLGYAHLQCGSPEDWSGDPAHTAEPDAGEPRPAHRRNGAGRSRRPTD